MKKPIGKRMIIMLLGVGVVFAAIIAYQMFVTSMMKKYLASQGLPPATVTTMKVQHQLWQPQLHAIGTLRAVQGVNVSSEIAGIVSKVYFNSGDWVKRGHLLLELDRVGDAAQLKSLRANRKLAEINYKRDKAQFQIHAISQSQLDASAAMLTSNRALEAKQQDTLNKKRIRAPFDGQLGIRTIDRGQFLNPATTIVSLQNTHSLFVDFNLPQQHITELRTGQVIRVNSNASHLAIRGQITALNSVVDRNTRNLLVEGKIANDSGMLLPGMFVRVAIDISTPQRWLTLPQTAISYNAYGSTVFVVKQAKQGDAKPVAQQVFVTTGDKRGDQVAIVSGLNAGDVVVTSGQIKLKNGTPLVINNQVLPANARAPKPQEF